MSDANGRKVAFITGAGSGIGRGAAKLFAADGYAVAAVDMNEDGGKATVEAIRAAGGEASFIPCNVANDDSVRMAVGETVSTYGRLDAAFNAAGIDGEAGKLTAEHSLENWQRVIDIDLNGIFYCLRHQIPAMLESGGGAIVNCASTAGIRGAAFCGPYSAAKHGVVGLTKAAGLEYAQQGVRINAVCPGMIRTPMTQAGPMKAVIDEMVLTTPMGRLGEPEEIGAMALWLCSDAASFVTAQAIAVDGAITSR